MTGLRTNQYGFSWGGDKDLGGHTANSRIAAARRGRPLALGVLRRREKEEERGQRSLFEEEART